ncbi:hypothetical protein LB533_15300 [Mesorhizobium sp. BR1-1-13]|uniref:hypothetical protein n=1 Tax=Mesorhizobium sp. BR1-1-13 TaxID=2876656 RepID=UPI001CD05AED|nr:hypothetical protein [Mesorhizobium sp. BR1-1-13]MBZ9942460.1 hypothetical protein [Mesorhizobium sp. BR1-1-13]
MTDIKTNDDLIHEYEKIQLMWAAEVRAEIPHLLEWWASTKDRLEKVEENLTYVRWPCGFIPHPRVIEIYRRYFFVLHDLNKAVGEYEDYRTDNLIYEGWGTDAKEASAAQTVPTPVPPNVLLLDEIKGYAPDLWGYMQKFLYLPIGENEKLELC